jgi:N-acetylmuramoyl-L-alanine amidase
MLLLAWAASHACIPRAHALTAKQAYFNGESCYKELRSSSQKMKHRENWLACIEAFQQVYRLDPSGPWAPAGLYMSGMLFQELALISGKTSDRQEALDAYERIRNRFPDSRYREKAEKEIRALTATGIPKKSAPPPEDAAKNDYLQAETCYNSLSQSPGKMKYRHNWLECAEKFHAIYQANPTGPWAAASLFMAAKLHEGLYQHSKREADLREAFDIYEQIIAEFPDSRYKVMASLLRDGMPQFAGERSAAETDAIAQTINTGSNQQIGEAPAESDPLAPHPDGIIRVEDLRFWSNPNYTRVVIDASNETTYYHHLLKKDPTIDKPQRLYVDLDNCRLGENIKKIIPINDDLLINARAGQFTNDSVRVVIDIKSFQSYKIFSLKDPYRIVIDVWGAAGENIAAEQPPLVTSTQNSKLPASALAKQLALGVRRIVIDAGHGGRDYGAPGYLKGVHEKDVTLQIARKLAQKIRTELKCEVIMTRNSDRFLTLEERTAIANTQNADLFISIHTNSHKDRRAYGIETYFLNLATDDEAIRVAAMENATSTKNISDLQTILFDLMQNAKINESSRLASHVQVSLVNHLNQKRYSRIKDKGVKQAPFYVLLGAQMPAILVETSFISNPRECERLLNPGYQDRLCEAIILGIKDYIREITPTALIDALPDSGNRG